MNMRLLNNVKRIDLIAFLLIPLLFMFSDSAMADRQYKVLVLPLTIYSEKNFSFLQKGIGSMLSNRLTEEGKVLLMDSVVTEQAVKDINKTIDERTAVALGARLETDYVLFGSVTIFGDKVSIEARFVDVRANKTVLTFNKIGMNQGDVMNHINFFAGQINKNVFGHKIKTNVADTPPAMIPVSKEKTFLPLWKSKELKTQITSIAVGDVIGNGENETVFISHKKIYISRYDNGILESVKEIKGHRFDSYIGVDVADINKNGKEEIFVTNLIRDNGNDTLESFVLEWNGKEFTKIADKENWYYRVLSIQSRGGKILLGQKRGEDDLFQEGIFELKWRSESYVPAAGREALPDDMIVYGYTVGDVLGKGEEMILAFDETDRIIISDKEGNEEWVSDESFGGSAIYLQFPSESFPEEIDEKYLPQRLHIVDVGNDGKNEVLVVKNQHVSRSPIYSRYFRTGHIECLTWGNRWLYPIWKTQEFTGHISDYLIADFDNDGQDELLYSVVEKTSALFQKGKSFLVSQDLD